MNPKSEAQSKLKRVDIVKSKRMEIEEPEVVRAQFLMSKFNIDEANRGRRSRNAMWTAIGVAIVLTAIAFGLIIFAK